MSSNVEFKDFVIGQLVGLDVSCKKMMGEYLLYNKDKLFGGIYDDRLLIKKTKSNEKFGLKEVVPYKNAKSMYEVDNLDDKEYLMNLITITCNELK